MNVEIGVTHKIFDLSEAKRLLPVIQAITNTHFEQLKPIQSRLNLMLSNDPRRSLIEIEYEQVVSRWRTKVEQLGALVTGLWLVGFDVGDGALSWKYPELSLSYFVERRSDFSERIKLPSYIEEFDPDWAH